MADWHAMPARRAAVLPAAEVCTELGVAGAVGLDGPSVRARAAVAGPNELPEDEEEPLWKKYLEQYKDPMIGLLLASVLVSLLVGQWDDAVSILIVRLVAAPNFRAATWHAALACHPFAPPPTGCHHRDNCGVCAGVQV